MHRITKYYELIKTMFPKYFWKMGGGKRGVGDEGAGGLVDVSNMREIISSPVKAFSSTW